ncbi:MAG: methyl-accepting chemotaxis protein [bacterium]
MRTTLRFRTIARRSMMGIMGLVLLMGLVEFWCVLKVGQTMSLLDRTYLIVTELNSLETHANEVSLGQRGFLITGKPEFLDPFFHGPKDASADFASLKKLILLPDQIERLKKIEELFNAYLDYATQNVELKKTGKDKEAVDAVSSGEERIMRNAISVKIDETIRAEKELLVERRNAAQQAEHLSNAVVVGGTLLVITVSFYILFAVNRRVVTPLNGVVNTIATSTTEIAAAVEQHEKTSAGQSASVNETTTTMDELEASFRQAADAAGVSAQKSQNAVQQAKEGSRVVGESVAAVKELETKINAIAERILSLSEQINQIGSITNVVGDLGNQTNMLALNAAVEAVRAGEHGKGFAVVAQEIRKLADQSRKSAERINVLVGDISKAANATVMVTEEGSKTLALNLQRAHAAGDAFAMLAEALTDANENAQQIVLNSKQQLGAVQQVTQAMNNLAVGSRETASGIAQTRIGLDRLKENAAQLETMI